MQNSSHKPGVRSWGIRALHLVVHIISWVRVYAHTSNGKKVAGLNC